MIPRAFLTEWQAKVPWPELYQVEQDLILSRLMIEIAQDELLKSELVMRGGTCLHKLHLAEPRRYSEDLDYVRRTHGPIKAYIDELREIADRVGLSVKSYAPAEAMFHLVLVAEPTVLPGVIRIKVETNIAETEYYTDTITIHHKVDSRWWQGEELIPTFALDEMMATKTRALYQRRKGRDLFDLWLVLTTEEVHDEEVVAGLRHYMQDDVFTYPQLRQNLVDKLEDAGFRTDMDALVTAMPDDYDVDAAADVVMERLASLLGNAPTLDEIRDGQWREQ